MSITDEEVKKIAKLAALQLSEADIPPYAGNINNILELVNQMGSVDTDAIKPMAHPFDASTRLRDDTVSETNQRDALLAIAPATESGLYLVPKVIEE